MRTKNEMPKSISPPKPDERRSMAGMIALSACKLISFITPDDHSCYRATAALISGNDDLAEHIETMQATHRRLIMALMDLSDPARGFLRAAEHAAFVVIRALQNDDASLEDCRRHFSLAQRATQDI